MLKNILPYLFGFTAAAIGSVTAVKLGLPIPWLLGALLVTAVLSINGAPVKSVAVCRQVGLGIIGISLGLYFTPDMTKLLVLHSVWLIAGMVFAAILGIGGSLLLYRWGRVDFKTAWFASCVGGASEMANLAGQHGARVDQVVAAHALRVLMVVSIVPFFYQFMGLHGADHSELSLKQDYSHFGLIALLAIGAVGGWIFERLKWSNPWTFGPLLAVILLTANDIHLSTMPSGISHIGQLFIGWALGGKFTQGFFQKAPRLLALTAVNVIIGLILTAGFAAIISHFSGIPVSTLGLALAPGGVAEMTITAKVLNLGIPVVTAFHVSRMIAVVASAGLLFKWIEKRLENKA